MIVVQEPAIAGYLERRLKIKIVEPYHAIGYAADDGRPLCGFVFNGFNRSNVDITVAAEKGGLTRGVLRDVSKYVFDQLKCRRVTATIKRSNKRALKAAERFGFKYEGVLKRYFPDADGIQFRMLREDCRWISDESSPSA